MDSLRERRSPTGRERERLLIAFVELAAERGHRDVAAAVVDRRAGLPPGTFDRYFADPAACSLAAWDQLEREYMRRLAGACADLGSWRDRFRVAAGETARLVEAYPRQAQFMTVEAITLGGEVSARQQALAARLAALVDSAREELEDPMAIPPATAGWVVALFFDRVYRRFTGEPGPNLSEQLPELMFLAISSYFGTEAGLAELDVLP